MHRLTAAILLATAILAAGGVPPAMAHPPRPVEQSTDVAPVAPATVFSPVAGGGPAERDPSQIPAGTVSLAPAPPSPLALVGSLLALAALLVVLGIRRQVLALGLALILGVLAFESAVHSVHHLGTSEESKCAVAVAAAHVQGTVDEPVVAPPEPRCAGVASAVVEPVRRAAQPWRAWRGRAPPSIPVS